MSPRARRPSAPTPPRLHRLRAVILPIAQSYGARNVRVFGSVARGDATPDSDIDLLVKMPDDSSLLDISGLKIDLEEALHTKVDVVCDDGISPYLRDRILSEALPL